MALNEIVLQKLSFQKKIAKLNRYNLKKYNEIINKLIDYKKIKLKYLKKI